MARANRLKVEGGIYHLTHRCQNRIFHLKFVRDRELHRKKVREGLEQFRLWLLDYCLTYGKRQRYWLLDLDRLCKRLGAHSLEEVRDNLEYGLREAIGAEQLKRESWWTESLAVGRPGFLEKFRPMIPSRMELKIGEEQEGLWVLKEPEIPYNAIPTSNSAANGTNHGSDEAQQFG